MNQAILRRSAGYHREDIFLAWLVTRAAINTRLGLTVAVHAFAHRELSFLAQTYTAANGSVTDIAFSASLRMLPMTKADKCRNPIHANPINIPVLLGKCSQLLLCACARSNPRMAGHALRDVRHINQFAAVGLGVAGDTSLLLIGHMKLVIEFDGLFRRVFRLE